jgi:hypothetical protein
MRLSCVPEDLRIMIYYPVSLALEFLSKTEYLYIQGQNAQQLSEVLGAIISWKQRNISTDLNHDQILRLRGSKDA